MTRDTQTREERLAELHERHSERLRALSVTVSRHKQHNDELEAKQNAEELERKAAWITRST
jgi:hypothetical protein